MSDLETLHRKMLRTQDRLRSQEAILRLHRKRLAEAEAETARVRALCTREMVALRRARESASPSDLAAFRAMRDRAFRATMVLLEAGFEGYLEGGPTLDQMERQVARLRGESVPDATCAGVAA